MKQNATYGYLYHSGDKAETGKARTALLNFPVPEKNLFIDSANGTDQGRPQYMNMIMRLCPGDTVIIPSLENLGDDYSERLDQWELITKEKWADIVVLDQPQLDTRPSADMLSGDSAAVLVLESLKSAEQKRKTAVKQSQQKGIREAMDRGVRFGRPRKPIPEDFPFVKEQWERHYINSREAAKRLGIAQQTFLRWAGGK